MKRFDFDGLIIGSSLFLILMIFVNFWNNEEEPKKEFTGISSKEFYVELPDIHRETEPLIEMKEAEEKYQPVIVTYKEMELTSLGWYYITAYCPFECGYNGSNYPTGWKTASGTICHRASYDRRISEPTTCAISRLVHNFGDEFYIKEFDRTFIAEDTGSGVKGNHLDLFYEEFGDVFSFPTGWYEVYEVDWIERTVVLSEEEVKEMQGRSATEYFFEKTKED